MTPGTEERAGEALTMTKVREAYESDGLVAAIDAMRVDGEVHVGNHSNCGDDAMGPEGPCRGCDAATLLGLVASEIVVRDAALREMAQELVGWRKTERASFATRPTTELIAAEFLAWARERKEQT